MCDVIWRVKTQKGVKKRRGPGLQQFRWKSFDNWRDGSWQVRVLAKEQELNEQEEAKKRGEAPRAAKASAGFRSI